MRATWHSRGLPGSHRVSGWLRLAVAALVVPGSLLASQLDLAQIATVSQSSVNQGLGPTNAVDGNSGTYCQTGDISNSYWQAALGRSYPMTRVEVVNVTSTRTHTYLSGLTLRIGAMDDQSSFRTNLVNPGSGGTWSVNLPPGLQGRVIWLGLENGQKNGGGTYNVQFAEVRVYGDTSVPYGLLRLAREATVSLSSTNATYGAQYAVDSLTNTFVRTENLSNSCWQAVLGRDSVIGRVEILNRSDAGMARMDGMKLRITDGASNTVALTTVTNPGAGGVWCYEPPAGTTGRVVRIGLEGGQTNGFGDWVVNLAEVRIFGGRNLAISRDAYMVRLVDSLPPATNANDNNFSTSTETTARTVDGYWETDLGGLYWVYAVRTTIPDKGVQTVADLLVRTTNQTVRLYDEAHQSVFGQMMDGEAVYAHDTELPFPVAARYVRVGLEDKRRTVPGQIDWFCGWKEVQVFGRPASEVGILDFRLSTNRVAAGQPVTLSWRVAGQSRAEVYPAVGSVGQYTGADGAGSLTLYPTQSTEYVMVASNSFCVTTRAASVEVDGQPLPVRISEVLAANRLTLKDGYGDASDWIELHNPRPDAVNLAGCGLSDDPAQPMRWVFPSVEIPANGFLSVFASGRSSPYDPVAGIHANLNLAAEGESVVLTAPDGTPWDSIVSFPAQTEDLAYGRDLSGTLGFIDPTPGQFNVASLYQGWLAPPQFSHWRGFYTNAFTLSITNPNPDSALCYSIDGTFPSLPYSNSIPVSVTRSVRAAVSRAGYKAPWSQAHTYIFIENVVTSSVMNQSTVTDPRYVTRVRQGLRELPTVAIATAGQPDYPEQEGSAEIFLPDGRSVQANCGVMRYGNAWTSFTKRYFRLKFRASYGMSKLKAPLFDGFGHGFQPLDQFDELDLRSGGHDMADRGFYMANPFVADSMLDMGSLNPLSRFVHVYLNGVYWGQYDMHEGLKDHFLADMLGGKPEDYSNVKGNDNATTAFIPGTPDPLYRASWNRVRSLRSSYSSIKSYVDMSNLIDFMLAWNYGNAENEFRCAGSVEAGSGYKFWLADADGLLRTSAMGLNNTANAGPSDILGMLRTEGNADFKTLLADRIYKHMFNNGALTPTQNTVRLNLRMTEVQNSMIAECARWGYRTPDNWVSAANDIRNNLFPGRTSQLFGYLRTAGWYPSFDPPTFSQYGGLVNSGYQLALSTSVGTIYYTLDGSDPRLPGGGISPLARGWTNGAATVTGDMTLLARVLYNGAWSALAEPRFLLIGRVPASTTNVVISEIAYNPPGTDEAEFVEVWNFSSNLVDFTGVTLSNAVEFSFPSGYGLPPGECAVVVKDSAAFAVRYQAVSSAWYRAGIRVAGEWDGSLKDGGETVTMLSSNGASIATVSYASDLDWPSRANGKGSTLELRDPSAVPHAQPGCDAYLADGRHWRSSFAYHGTPGWVDPDTGPVVINEVLAHTDAGVDWIELYNRGSAPADLSGCFLTDHESLQTRFQIPTNTVLQPGGFVSFDLNEMGFGFSELGADILLLRCQGTNILRFLDTTDIPATRREESLGNYTRSDGLDDFTELRANTREGTNSLPRVGPLVFSEIMYRPSSNRAEFVEFVNVSHAPVALYDALRPTNTWQLAGAVDFSFPTGVVVQSGGTILVCGTNAAAFRAQYGLDESVPVYGPWAGSLDNAGETIRLRFPGDPEPDGFVPYYRCDWVAYRPAAPWPAEADAGNVSLEKTLLEAYGNDPVYWSGSVTGGTPGATSPGRAPHVTGEGTLELDEGQPVSVSISAGDPDGPWQTWSVSLDGLPAGGWFDSTNSLLLWQTGEADGPGVYTGRVVVTDDSWSLMSATQEVVITVRELNEPPLLDPLPDVQYPAALDLVIQPQASDPDLPPQTLFFSQTGLPDGVALDPWSGRMTGQAALAGEYPVELVVSDGQTPPLTATNHFVLRVTAPFVVQGGSDVNGAIEMSCPVLSGQTYEVQYTDDLLLSNSWQVLERFDATGTAVWTVSDPSATNVPMRFYRINWVR